MDERYDGGQIAVGQRLAIDALDDIVVGLSALGEKLVAQRGGQPALQYSVEKVASQHCPTALVAKDIA